MTPIKPSGRLTAGAIISIIGLSMTILSTFALVLADYVQNRATLRELQRDQAATTVIVESHDRRIASVESRVSVLDDRYARP